MSGFNLYPLAKKLSFVLRDGNLTLCVAESCTGGSIARTLTAISGASAWFERGFVTYSNQAKVDMLGVDVAMLKERGAVSEAVATAMAEGAIQHSHADIALSVTGIAGPTGGSADKPVGMVWFGMARRNAESSAALKHFPGARHYVRRSASLFAIDWLLRELG